MKKTNENLILLNIIFVISIVIANVVGCKIFNTGIYIGKYELAMSGGALWYRWPALCYIPDNSNPIPTHKRPSDAGGIRNIAGSVTYVCGW